jgi:hypothetical protein
MPNRPSFEDLAEANALSDGALEPEVVEEEVVPEPDVEPEEVIETEGDQVEPEELSHAEKTQRGRERAEKLRKSEAENERLATELVESQIRLAKIEGQMEERDRQGPLVAPPEEPFDPDETLTRGELEEVLRKEAEKLRIEREKVIAEDTAYASKYKELVFSVLDSHEKKDKILELFRSNKPEDIDKYDTRHFGNPARDFEINLANAERDILKAENVELIKQLGGKNPKVREDEPDGAGVAGDVEPKPKPKVELIDATDPDSQAYMTWLKVDDPKAYDKLKEKYRT